MIRAVYVIERFVAPIMTLRTNIQSFRACWWVASERFLVKMLSYVIVLSTRVIHARHVNATSCRGNDSFTGEHTVL